MKFLVLIVTILLTTTASAEIKIVEVANGKAVIQFDKSDELTMDSKLVLKNLSLSTTSGSAQLTELTCPACPSPIVNTQLPAIEREYKRTHLITGHLDSYTTESTEKTSTTSDSTESTTVELDASYYYNFKNFGLGFTIYNKKVTVEGDEDIQSIVGFGGKFFFIENVSKNKVVPYIGFEFIGANAEFAATPTIEAKLSGSRLDLGVNIFLTDSAFADIKYSVGAVDGDISQGTVSNDYEIEQTGFAIGFGIALE